MIKSSKSRFFILFQSWRMHAPAWLVLSGWENEMEEMQDEELDKSPAAGLMVEIRDEQLAGTPAAGLMEEIQEEQLPVAGDLAVGLAGTGAPSRAHQSFSRCKMTQRPNPNLAR